MRFADMTPGVYVASYQYMLFEGESTLVRQGGYTDRKVRMPLGRLVYTREITHPDTGELFPIGTVEELKRVFPAREIDYRFADDVPGTIAKLLAQKQEQEDRKKDLELILHKMNQLVPEGWSWRSTIPRAGFTLTVTPTDADRFIREMRRMQKDA